MIGDHPTGVELVGRPSRRSRIGRETLPEVQLWSGVPSEGPQLVGRPSRKFASGRKPPGGVELVGRPSRKVRK